MLEVRSITKSYAGKTILSDISFALHPGQKIALVGPNGSGKSTLLKILAGLEEPDSGNVSTMDRNLLGYLPQEFGIDEAKTIQSYLADYVGISQIEEEMQSLENDLGDPVKADRYADLQQLMTDLNGYSFDSRMKTILSGLGLIGISQERNIVSLSGGQKTKVALAGVLLRGADTILLDEPTNNLDLPSVLWLEKYLASSKAACLLVSHDRRFVDRIVGKVFEINWHERTLTEFTGNYTELLAYKEKKIVRDEAILESQKQEIDRLQKSANEKRSWGGEARYQVTKDNDKYIRGANRDRSTKSSNRATALVKKIDQITLVEPEKRRDKLDIPLSASDGDRGRIVLESIRAGYLDFKIGPIDLTVEYGQRVGIMGRNGCGKSTLLKIISGELEPIQGKLRIGSCLIIGNLMQGHEDLPRELSMIEFLTEERGINRQEACHLLKKFHFAEEDFSREIDFLSPGERARLLLIVFAAESVNVLLLDEPTNHLDIDAIAALEGVLASYSGTVIFISHDRYFLDKVKANRLFDLSESRLKEIVDINDYLCSLTD